MARATSPARKCRLTAASPSNIACLMSLLYRIEAGHDALRPDGDARGRPSMNRITGRSAFLALLEDEGVTHLFGNPGTTELPIMHALKEHPDLTYVMAMQESLVVAIADGFSRAS